MESTRSGAGTELRPRSGFGTWPLIVLGAALTVAGAAATAATTPCDEFHVAAELAGSDRRLATWLDGCSADLGDARLSLLADGLLIAGYALLLGSILRRWWPLYHAVRLKAITRAVVAAPFVAGGLDVIENLLIALSLGDEGGRFTYPDTMVAPIAIATVSWLKWTVGAVSVLAAIGAIGLALARRGESGEPAVEAEHTAPIDVPAAPADALGVCCSGGGIRAAAFSLGALERLEAHGVMARARWLTAVSGGSYAATAWRLAKADDPSAPAATDVLAWLRAPIPGSSGGRHRFLRNGPGGLGRPILAALTYITFNLVSLAAFVFALAWPLGWLLGSHAIQPALRRGDRLPDRLDVPAELWLPGVALLGLAFAVLLISALPTWKLADLWWKLAVALLAAGVLLELVLVVMPLLMVTAGSWITGGTDGLRASALGASAFAGVAVSVWRIVKTPVIGRVTKRLPELGGVLLAAAAVVWGGKVATDAAVGAGVFRSAWWWVSVTAAFVAVYALVPTTPLSIHRIYRKRLRRTFGLRRRADGEVYAPKQDGQLRWSEMPADDPELVICCAQQRTGIAPGGLPAETFTISRQEVRIGADTVPAGAFLARLDEARLGVEQYVSSWMATSGAAFASAMGRLSKGSTNALMAALNIDLGIWLPNPRLVADRRNRFRYVRLGYLFKEILGWYDPKDRFVFVADGGHWENLGLVELLRRRCPRILCIDASGDSIGAFTTLRQAVELAGLELPDVIGGIDLTDLEAITGQLNTLPTGIVATLRVEYKLPDGTTSPGTILYAKAQLASTLDVALRRFAKQDPLFPNYSTGDQFLRDEQFAQLVELGRAAGDRLAELAVPAAQAVTTVGDATPTAS